MFFFFFLCLCKNKKNKVETKNFKKENQAVAAAGAEALILATEWPEFAVIDLAELRDTMRTPLIFDGRNLIDPVAAASFGFQYHGIGRGIVQERTE